MKWSLSTSLIPCVSLRGQYCFTVCVKSFGPLTRNYYVRAFLHAAWVHYVSCFSFAGQHSCHSQSNFRYCHYSPLSSKSLSVFNSICVPGGFMLATVLGCVCLGIASIIYFVVSWSNFVTFDKLWQEVEETRKWQQGRHCFITGTSYETSPCSCAIWPVRGVASRSLLTCFPRHLFLFLGSNPRWALGAHSSKEGEPDASRREHQESPSESTTETSRGDSQETCGRPGGRSLWQPHLCHRQLVAGPPPRPPCSCLPDPSQPVTVRRHQTPGEWRVFWWLVKRGAGTHVGSTPSYLNLQRTILSRSWELKSQGKSECFTFE